MTNGMRAVAIAVVLVGTLVLTTPLWRSSGSETDAAGVPPPEDAGSGEAAGPGASADGAALPPAANAGTQFPPLPSLDVPLRLAVDDLRRRADAGDASAACRLAAEFARCGSLRNQLSHRRSWRERMEGRAGDVREETVDDFVRILAQMDADLAQTTTELEHCEGVEAPDAGQRARYWRSAALGGHPAALRQYAIGNAFRFEDLMSAVPELDVYRREAEAIARRAARAGDPAMIHALALAYLPPHEDAPENAQTFTPFLGQVIQPDAGQALSWLYALQQHPAVRALPGDHPVRERAERELERLARQQGVEAVAAANARASEWARAWPPSASEAAELQVFDNGGLMDVSREECGPG